MAVRRLNHAVLYVRDLAGTVDFYRATLGFEVRTEIPGRAAFLRAPGSANDHDLGLFEVMWRVPAEDWALELRGGQLIAPLDLDGELARWGDRVTGAAAGSVT